MERTGLYSDSQNLRNPRIFVINSRCEVQEYRLNRTVQIGRSRSQNPEGIVISSPIVSRVHGAFVVEGTQVFYRDLNSSNGTYINGQSYGVKGIAPGKELVDGDVLKIDNDIPYETHPEAVIIIYRDRLHEPVHWHCVSLDNQAMEINIGRSGETNNLAIADIQVSSQHASFFRGAEGWAITDHNSTNGVYLNNNRLLEPLYLNDMDCVRIVNHMFIYNRNMLLYSISHGYQMRQDPAQELQRQREVDNHQMESSVSSPMGESLYINIVKRTVRHGLFKKLTLLKDINLTINAGEMVLILGGSGAGKTTFMNAVMGYEKASGSIRHGQIDIYSQYNQMKYAIGFVPQDTLLRESDTVYDTLFNAAQLKMPQHCTNEERKQRVQDVLEMVALTHVSSSLIKSISGGEKKRVSAGVELVADPSLFFLDEPDSGLDAQSAIELMENLRNIANTGKIVMIISHSPDRAAKLFDKVIVLAKSREDNSGHLAFYGSVNETKRFFDTDSLEGVVGRINGKDGMSEQYIEKWQRMTQNQ